MSKQTHCFLNHSRKSTSIQCYCLFRPFRPYCCLTRPAFSLTFEWCVFCFKAFGKIIARRQWRQSCQLSVISQQTLINRSTALPHHTILWVHISRHGFAYCTAHGEWRWKQQDMDIKDSLLTLTIIGCMMWKDAPRTHHKNLLPY